MWYDYGHSWGSHPHFFHGPFSILLVLLLIALIVLAIRFLVKGKHRDHHHHDEPKKADSLVLLETRYVQGEIDRDEFLKKKADLLDNTPPSA